MNESHGSAAKVLIALTQNGIHLFHSPGKEGFAAFGNQTFPLKSESFGGYAAHLAYRETKQVTSAQTLMDVTNSLNGRAVFDAPEERIETRIAHRDVLILSGSF